MKTRLWTAVVVVLLATAFLAPRPIAQSQESWPCDELIVDRAGILGPGIDRVRDAADRLVKLGADVRVFTVDTTGMNDLDRFMDNLQDRCPSWQSDSWAIKRDLIVIGISVEERLTGLYYGEQWSTVLDDEQFRIQTDLMNARFAADDFSGGILAGLEEIARLIDLRLHPVPTTMPTTTSGSTTSPSPIAGIVLVGMAGLAALGGGLFIGTSLFRKRAVRRRAQQNARETKIKVASRILELQERFTFLEVDIEGLSKEVSPESVRRLRDQLADIQRQARQTSSDYESVQQAGNDPDREGLSTEEYQGYQASYQKLLDALNQADKTAGGIQQQIRALQQVVAQVPETLTHTQAAIDEARQLVEERTHELANKYAVWLLGAAQVKLDEARAASEDKRPQEALDLSAEVKTLLDQTITATSLLPSLQKRIEEVDQLIDTGAETFDKIAQHYAESSWDAIRGDGTEAENRVDWAVEALELASEEFASEEEEDWQEARQRLEEANGWLDEAVSLIESIHALAQNLEKARQGAPQEVQSAQADIRKAGTYIDQYDPDIREQLESDLKAARDDLLQAVEELAQKMPDYLRAVALAQGANEAADRILEEARSEHETIERLRGKYKSVSRSAKGTISRTQHYIRNHGPDVGNEARETLDRAREKLASAAESRTAADELEDTARRTALEKGVSLAQEAEPLAAKAYEQARQDFQRAESRRPSMVVPIPVSGPSSTVPSGRWGFPKPAPRSRRSESPRRSGGPSGWSTPSSPSPRRRGSSGSWSTRSSSRRSGGSSTSWSRSSSRQRGGSSTGW